MKKEKYLYGDLVQEEELNKAAKQRKKKYQEIRVPNSEVPSFLRERWQLKKQLKTIAKLRKDKDCGELLEDESWLLFKNMGFTEMNKDRNFEIQAGPIKKQIDVFAKDGNNIFVIECKAQSEKGPRYLRKDIHEILNLREDIIKSLRKHYKHKFRVSFLLVTKNIIWNPTDEKLASANKKNRFFAWKEKDLEAYTNLTNQQGEDARFQMYSILFRKVRINELKEIKVPAMRGGKGEKKYYVFVIQPEKLLHGVAYVHRREESNPEEASKAYQRMLKKSRLKEILKYIDEKGRFFPNNIILNFTQKPTFEPFGPKIKFGDIAYGILRFPPYYGSAWVIDGQHRLYGYSKSKRKATDTLPVVAFEGLSVKEQANLFVDINKEQRKVSSNLRWDLYPDIYCDSEDPEQQLLRAISLVVKKLNSKSDSPLHKHIYIPSVPREAKGITNLTIANVCDGLKDNKLVESEEKLLYEKDYDYTVDFASKRIKAYFDVIAKSFPQDWEKGNKGVLRTNIGIRIFLIILRQLLRYLKYEGQEKIYRKKDLDEFENKTKEILGPILTKLKEMSDAERDKIRKGSSKGMVLENAQILIWDLKEEFNFGLELWRKDGWTPEIPKEEGDEQIKKLIDDTEIQVRSFIIQELKKLHEKSWWKEGVPEGIKDYIKRVISQDIAKTPWKKKELLSYPEDKKLVFASTSHLKEIIINRKNWKQFEEAFARDKEIVSTAFKFFEAIRNKYIHPEREEELAEIERGLGYWNMRWIRRCIGLDSVEKKA